MNFIISEQPFVYKEFLMYMQTIRGKSIGTISEYALDLNIFFKFMSRHFKIDNSKNLNKKFEAIFNEYLFPEAHDFGKCFDKITLLSIGYGIKEYSLI